MISGVLIFVNELFNVIPLLAEYSVLLYLLFIVTAFSGIIINFSRGLDKIKQTAISGVVCSAIIILLNIIFLIPLRMGLTGYFLANILGALSQCLYLVFAIKAWRYFKISKYDKKLEEEMLTYASPLLVNGISWWVSSASDRYIVTWLRGIAENGIYSVGYKIPSILNIFQTIFSQAWTLSAVHDFDPEDKNNFFTDMYNLYNFCMTLVCSILIVFTKIMAKLLYAKDFYVAWQYVPFLLIAIVFGALSGYIGGIFAAVKDTKIFANTSIVGAVINIVLNVVLINIIGTIGAAIATAICYVVIWALRMINVKRYITIHLNVKRDIMGYVILLIQSIMFYITDNNIVLYAIEFALLVILPFLFIDVVKPVMKKMKGKLVGI